MARILIADDSLVMRRNLRTILTSAGHQVVAEASNGRQAVVEYEKANPDVVTMDITMPVMDGIEAVKQIIAKDLGARIIMISALDQKKMVFEALENGAKHYIIKPFASEKVLNIINEVLIQDKMRRIREEDNKSNENNSLEDSPFTIENQNGTFIIHFYDQLDMESYQNLHMAIQGFLYIKPLKVVYNFGNIPYIEPEVLDKILEGARAIKNVGGEIKAVSNNREFVDYVNKKEYAFFE